MGLGLVQFEISIAFLNVKSFEYVDRYFVSAEDSWNFSKLEISFETSETKNYSANVWKNLDEEGALARFQ